MGAIIPLPGCDNAQACYWYQQGCTIGCPTCDHVSGRVQVDLCGLGKVSVSTFVLCLLTYTFSLRLNCIMYPSLTLSIDAVIYRISAKSNANP